MKQSAGILLYRLRSQVEVFLVHPGGPFWAKKDAGAWSIPKGEFNEEEDPLDAALREFREETGMDLTGSATPLTPVKMKSGKRIHAYAIEGDIDPATIISNQFTIEWPPRSGKMASFPEVDKGGWFSADEARVKIIEAQWPLVAELIAMLRR